MATVALVGRRLPHNENLGLGYLRASLRRAELGSITHWLNGGGQIEPIAGAILAAPPAVVGLSLPDGGSAMMLLALGELLRRRGYLGHITSGGPFATLARDWLLERYPWLDSVVRFAGEVPLVELTRHVLRGGPVAGVPGVTTREGDGAPAPVLDSLPMGLAPERDALHEVLGMPAAHMLASRGCRGRCHYCGPAALQTLERAEGRRAGAALPQLDACGVGTIRRRELDALCDEMAMLWHERGVRYFYFVDEHLVPYAEPEAVALLRAWREGLARRGVGAFGLGAMLRADRLTPAIVRELAALGMIRCFVGLELAGTAEARRYGRTAPGTRELELVAELARLGIATVSNVMLLHPDSTPDTIAASLNLCARIPAGVVEPTRMMVYHGTRLHERIAAAGRLLGNPLRYGYVFDRPEIERFAEVLTRLRGQSFHDYSVACRTHDAFLGVALARRLRLPGTRAADRLERVRADVNALYVGAYRRALDLALAGGGYDEAGPLVASAARRAAALEAQLDVVERELHEGAPGPVRMHAPMRAAAASVITFVLSTAACGGSHTRSDGGRDAGRDAGSDAGGDARTAVCTPERIAAGNEEARATALAADACFAGSVHLPPDGSRPEAYFTTFSPLGGGGAVLRPCPTSATTARIAAIQDRVATAVAARRPECSDEWVQVSGRAQTDLDRMATTASTACGPDLGSASFTIVLDAAGAVVEVRSEPPGSAAADCVRAALAGLTFPCLASFEVCPEFVIVE